MLRHLKPLSLVIAIYPVFFLLPFAFSGCDNKEKVLDIETPAGEVEVEKDKSTGEVDVEVEEK